MKNAPNLKYLPKDKFTEAIIFAGADAYAHAKGWEEGLGKKIAEDTTPPIYLGSKQIADLDNLRIIDDGRRAARIYLAGEIEPIMINAIGEKLARAGVQAAKLFKGIPDRNPEDWSEYLARLRDQAERGESVVINLPLKGKQQKKADDMTPYVDERPEGLFLVTPKLDKETGEILRPGQILCNLLQVAGVGIGVDDEARYLILRWTPAGGKTKRTEAIPMRDIGDREGWARLRAGGLFITANPRLRNVLADHLLRDTASCELWHIASVTGWQCGAYIMPDGEIIGTPETPVMFNGRSSASGGYSVAGRFAVMESALILSTEITGWDPQTCRDAIQHTWNSWIHEFGTANKEHQQIIEQCEAFLNAHGYSRFAPLPYSPADLPIQSLAGYRQKKSAHDSEPIIFYTFPAAFEKEIASGFNPSQFARVLAENGMLTPPVSGRGYQRKSPRVDGRQVNVYVIQHMPEEPE